MKKKIKMLGCMMLAATLTLVSNAGQKVSAAEKTSKYTKAVEAYQNFLKTTSMEGTRIYGNSDLEFQIVDVNKDNVPELIINTEAYHGLSETQRIYTYYNGKVKFLATTGQGYFAWYAKGDLLLNNQAARGTQYSTYYTISKGRLKEAASFYTDDGWSMNPVFEYKINNKKVSKKKFNEFIKKRTKTTMYNTMTPKSKSCTKKNIDAISKYKKVALSETKLTLNEGKKKTLTFYSYQPSFTWTSSNTKVATVSKSGKITAKKKGTCTIKVTDGKNTKTCKVTVKGISKADKAYKDYINKYKYTKYTKNDGLEIYSYSYLDIDGNGTKELIVYRDSSYDIYTYTGGKMKKVGTMWGFANWFMRYNKTDKTIVMGDGDAGGPGISIYSVKNNKLVQSKTYYYIDTYDYSTNGLLPESRWTYYKDSKKLSGNELTKCKKAISGSEIKFTYVS